MSAVRTRFLRLVTTSASIQLSENTQAYIISIVCCFVQQCTALRSTSHKQVIIQIKLHVECRVYTLPVKLRRARKNPNHINHSSYLGLQYSHGFYNIPSHKRLVQNQSSTNCELIQKLTDYYGLHFLLNFSLIFNWYIYAAAYNIKYVSNSTNRQDKKTSGVIHCVRSS